MARSKKQKHGPNPGGKLLSGRGVMVDGFEEIVPRQAKSSQRRHANMSAAERKANKRH